MKCATHPDVETNLACSKCGKPICPKCLVQTPVGARCRDCARSDKIPTYTIRPTYYLRAVGAALGAALACGFVWAIIEASIRFVSFNILLAGAAGYAIAELVSRSVNRKRGTGLAVIAASGVVIAYLVTIVTFRHSFPGFGLGLLFDLLAIGLGIVIAVNRLR